jgi:zinc-ribbon domain
MHCKQCGNPIDSNSKFCSYCGVNVDPPTLSQPQVVVEALHPKVYSSDPTHNIFKSRFSRPDRGLLIAFIMMLGLRLFWIIVN